MMPPCSLLIGFSRLLSSYSWPEWTFPCLAGPLAQRIALLLVAFPQLRRDLRGILEVPPISAPDCSQTAQPPRAGLKWAMLYQFPSFVAAIPPSFHFMRRQAEEWSSCRSKVALKARRTLQPGLLGHSRSGKRVKVTSYLSPCRYWCDLQVCFENQSLAWCECLKLGVDSVWFRSSL